MTATTVPALAVLAKPFPGLLDLAGRVAARTLAEYRRDIHHYLTFCRAKKHKPHAPQSLRAWRTEMADCTSLSPNTINRRLIVVKRVVRATALLGNLPMETAQNFKLVEPVQASALRSRLRTDIRIPLQPDQVKALTALPDANTLHGLRDRALLATFTGSGCRISEIVSLQVDDILASKDGWLLRVLGKGQSTPRLAPLDRVGHEAITAWLGARAPHIDVQAVFTAFGPGAHGRPTARAMSANAAWRVVRKVAAAAEMPHVKPHDFRRFVGTQLAASDLRQAQLALGHRRLETTARHYVLDKLEPGLTDGLY